MEVPLELVSSVSLIPLSYSLKNISLFEFLSSWSKGGPSVLDLSLFSGVLENYKTYFQVHTDGLRVLRGSVYSTAEQCFSLIFP